MGSTTLSWDHLHNPFISLFLLPSLFSLHSPPFLIVSKKHVKMKNACEILSSFSFLVACLRVSFLTSKPTRKKRNPTLSETSVFGQTNNQTKSSTRYIFWVLTQTTAPHFSFLSFWVVVFSLPPYACLIANSIYYLLLLLVKGTISWFMAMDKAFHRVIKNQFFMT